MRCVIFLGCFLGAIQAGVALNCYKCNGCETAKIMKEACREVDFNACMTQKIHVGGTPEPITIKKCITHDTNDKFDCPSLPDSDTLSCQICERDFCNSAVTAKMNFYHYLCLFVVFLVPILHH